MSPATWARWLVIPLALGLAFGVTRTDAVKDARFEFSRGSLDQMAGDVMAGGSLDRGWVGLYDVGTAEGTANGFRFVILWTGAWFEHLDGPWWAFQQSWD